MKPFYLLPLLLIVCSGLLFSAAGDTDILEESSSLLASERGLIKPCDALAMAGEHRLGPSDPATLDIMILYTPAALNWANINGGGINNLLNTVMSTSQTVLNNSQAGITLNLVWSGAVDYTESGDVEVDLVRLATKPGFEPYGSEYNGFALTGYMDDIHAIRDAFGADLVILWEYISSTGGVSWQLETTDGMPDYAFSINRVQQASTYTPIHEMGHCMGAGHHKLQSVQPGPGLFSYGAGWRWTGTNNGHYCDVMTYTAGSYYADGITHSRVPYFSSPLTSYQSVPTGDATDGDNARCIRESKHIVAGYRSAAFPVPWGINITRVGEGVFLNWEDAPYANSYKVFAASRPDAPSIEWIHIATVGVSQYADPYTAIRFYRVVSSSSAP
jgi:hypothetical protein